MVWWLALLPVAAPTLQLARAYHDGETERYQVTIVGEAGGTDLRVDARLRQVARVRGTGPGRLVLSVEEIRVQAYGETQSVARDARFDYEIDASGRIVSGWAPEARSAAGIAFLPYLLYGRGFEVGRETAFDYTDPRVRGWSVHGSARLDKLDGRAEFSGTARIRSALSQGRPTVLSFRCTFDPRGGRLLAASGSYSATLQAERPVAEGQPKLSGMQFELRRL
ncbi:MAG: hypothetical protein N2109_00175 [Fimbriimonadales bacterium]|nr:hypothetical protein [Fimbriimonadales bacterium]